MTKPVSPELRLLSIVLLIGGPFYLAWGAMYRLLGIDLNESFPFSLTLALLITAGGLIMRLPALVQYAFKIYITLAWLVLIVHFYLLNTQNFNIHLVLKTIIGFTILTGPVQRFRPLVILVIGTTLFTLIGTPSSWAETYEARLILFLLLSSSGCLIVYNAWSRQKLLLQLRRNYDDLLLHHDSERILGEQVQQSVEKFQIFFESAPVCVAKLDLNMRFIEANPAWIRLLGYTPEQLFGRSIEEITPVKNQTDPQELIHQHLESSSRTFSFLKQFCHANGSILWGQTHGRQVCDRDGVPKYFIIFVSDETENVRTYEALCKNVEENDLLIQKSPLGVVVIDPERRFLRCNPAFQQMVGYSLAELSSMNVFDLIHPDDVQKVRGISDTLSQNLKQSLAPFEERKIRKDGSTLYARVYSSIIETPEPGKNVVMSIIEDISETRVLQDELIAQRTKSIAASKMAALGEMSSGIAHEINNPLSIIAGKAEQLLRLAEDPQEKKTQIVHNAEKIRDTAYRIASIIRGLRTFARDADTDPFVSFSVREIIEQTLPLCQTRFQNNGIDIKIAEIPQNLTIEGRPTQISQVILNLMGNAYDAIQTLNPKWIEISAVADQSFVYLKIKDSGSGIPVELREKIMQPFFTTKEVGKGTGLGLSISSGILKAHRGRLFVDAECPNTCFVVQLPIRQGLVSAS